MFVYTQKFRIFLSLVGVCLIFLVIDAFMWVRVGSPQYDYLTDKQEILLKSASHGNVDAQFALGEFYEKGNSLDLNLNEKVFRRDYGHAFHWYQKAAKNENVAAMYALAKLYDNGHGVRQNTDLAIFWYQKAAELKNLKAGLSLGFIDEIKAILEHGQDEVTQAERWYGDACDGGIEEGCENYARLKKWSLGSCSVLELENKKRIFQKSASVLFDLSRIKNP